MKPIDSQTTLTISESCDLPTQQHYTKKKVSCCDCFHRKCPFRLWQILVFLLVIAFVIAVMGLLIAMFGPGNANLKYSKSESKAYNPTETIQGGTEPTPSTKRATEGPTGRTTKEAPCKPLDTTVPPTTFPSDDRIPIQCDVAIVGGGISGLLTAYALLKNSTETNVCILEKENRLGGKIFDHRFADAPNVPIGLGEWHIYGENYDESDLALELQLGSDVDYWNTRKVHRVEDRGVYAESFDSLKSEAFPTLLYRTPTNNMTILETASLVTKAISGNGNDLPTAGRFLSSILSPEGNKWMTDAYGLKGGYMEKINLKSYKEQLKMTLYLDEENRDDFRPKKGMSKFVENLILRVRNLNGTIYLQETVTSVNKRGNSFKLLTSNFTVQANKMVLTAAPEALKKIKGDVVQNITNHDIFKSIVSVPAFRGAAVYPTAWWNDSVALQKNNSLQNLQMFISNSNCLGITMPYKSSHNNGTAVLHTIANNGGCSDNWGNILKVSKDAVDKEIKRALEYKFQREIPEPMDTAYKYWEEGFWFFQKPGTNFSLTDLRAWAKKPLDGNNVFLVGRAFYQFGGWLQDDIKSTAKALKQGWNLPLELDGAEITD